MGTTLPDAEVQAVSPHVIAMRNLEQGKPAKPLVKFALGELDAEVRTTHDSVFVMVRRQGRGGVALRAAYLMVRSSAPRSNRDRVKRQG
jgi:hypothetical protein